MKKIISLGLACALAVSPLSCNFAFANESVAESEVSTTNNENSKCKVDEETLNKLAKKLKKANKEEMEALAEKVNKKDAIKENKKIKTLLDTIWACGLGSTVFLWLLGCALYATKNIYFGNYVFSFGIGLSIVNLVFTALSPFISN